MHLSLIFLIFSSEYSKLEFLLPLKVYSTNNSITLESRIIGGVGIIGGGRGGGLDIVIIINNRGIGIIGGLDGIEKVV